VAAPLPLADPLPLAEPPALTEPCAALAADLIPLAVVRALAALAWA
jgi:hypothetical protein